MGEQGAEQIHAHINRLQVGEKMQLPSGLVRWSVLFIPYTAYLRLGGCESSIVV